MINKEYLIKLLVLNNNTWKNWNVCKYNDLWEQYLKPFNLMRAN